MTYEDCQLGVTARRSHNELLISAPSESLPEMFLQWPAGCADFSGHSMAVHGVAFNCLRYQYVAVGVERSSSVSRQWQCARSTVACHIQSTAMSSRTAVVVIINMPKIDSCRLYDYTIQWWLIDWLTELMVHANRWGQRFVATSLCRSLVWSFGWRTAITLAPQRHQSVFLEVSRVVFHHSQQSNDETFKSQSRWALKTSLAQDGFGYIWY